MVNFQVRWAVVCAAVSLAFGASANAQDTPRQGTRESPPAAQQTPPATSTPAADSTPVEPISIEPFYWLTRATPDLRAGKADSFTQSGNLDFPGHSQYSPGGILSIPAGPGNALRISRSPELVQDLVLSRLEAQLKAKKPRISEQSVQSDWRLLESAREESEATLTLAGSE